ncbi:MAG: hypothetical protein NC920_00910 [Candidatus Omnitrophica bacterium]|nr:hypothetical protein [Candidatus Omnitrophota bacterium]
MDRDTLLLLEERGLIRLLRPPAELYRYRENGSRVEEIYSSAPRFGTHKLICVVLNTQEIILNVHPDNEDFILLSADHLIFKPLYLVLALHKYKSLKRKIEDRQLSEKDFIALRLRYNQPLTSVFTLLKDTVHAEVTPKGRGRPPIFFVTEPSKLISYSLNLKGYKLFIEHK